MNFEEKYKELSKVMEDLFCNRINPAQAVDMTYSIDQDLNKDLNRAKEYLAEKNKEQNFIIKNLQKEIKKLKEVKQ